jgi:uncharacterized protein
MLFAASASDVRSRSRLFTPLVLSALALLAACGSDTGPTPPHELDGTPVAVGNGTAMAYVMTSSGAATSIGVALSNAALEGLPSTDTEWSLPLPSGVSAPPFDHVMLNWNAQGHPPMPYMLPHFDFHFYTITTAEQAAITPGADTVTVPAQYVPTDYISGIQAVPNMGVHWVDTLSAEFTGHTFDHTFIYGFTKGTMAFLEPMVTQAYLASSPDVTAAVKQPDSFQKPGRYPAWYSVKADAAKGVVRVSLDSLTDR